MNFVKKTHKAKEETRDKNSENYINTNPTEEQLKDNKNGTVAVVLSIIAGILLMAIIALIILIFANNLGMGLLSIALLLIPAYLQMAALKKAKKQLNINGKGKTKLLFVKFIFPIISATISVIIIFSLVNMLLKNLMR